MPFHRDLTDFPPYGKLAAIWRALGDENHQALDI